MKKYVEGATYQVGDKVRVISYLTKYKHLFGLKQEMIDEYGGKEVTISYVGHYNNMEKFILLIGQLRAITLYIISRKTTIGTIGQTLCSLYPNIE